MELKDIVFIAILLLITLALFSLSLNGRYDFVKINEDDQVYRFDTRTGEVEVKKNIQKWEQLYFYTIEQRHKAAVEEQ